MNADAKNTGCPRDSRQATYLGTRARIQQPAMLKLNLIKVKFNVLQNPVIFVGIVHAVWRVLVRAATRFLGVQRKVRFIMFM